MLVLTANRDQGRSLDSDLLFFQRRHSADKRMSQLFLRVQGSTAAPKAQFFTATPCNALLRTMGLPAFLPRVLTLPVGSSMVTNLRSGKRPTKWYIESWPGYRPTLDLGHVEVAPVFITRHSVTGSRAAPRLRPW